MDGREEKGEGCRSELELKLTISFGSYDRQATIQHQALEDLHRLLQLCKSATLLVLARSKKQRGRTRAHRTASCFPSSLPFSSPSPPSSTRRSSAVSLPFHPLLRIFDLHFPDLPSLPFHRSSSLQCTEDFRPTFSPWSRSDGSCDLPMFPILVRKLSVSSVVSVELAKLTFLFSGLLCDLLWSDPDKDITGWSENDRGVSFTFGGDVVARFLQRHDLELVCRAHQVVEVSLRVRTRDASPFLPSTAC